MLRLQRDTTESADLFDGGPKKKIDRSVRSELENGLKPLWRFAYALSGRADLADDLVQATCLRALDKANQADLSRALLPWFMTICRSIWLNEKRAQAIRRAQSLDTTPEFELISKDTGVETNILSRQVYTMMMALPEAQRSLAVLVFVEGFSYTEAAQALDVPLGTVMSRLHAVRNKMKAAVDGRQKDGMTG